MSDPSYAAACAAVADSFAAAYPEYVANRLEVLAADVDVAAGVEQGNRWLRAELSQWAQRPAASQRRGPLQVFQAAAAFPTAALEAAGVPPIPRDPLATQAIPGDLYGLAPASSRDIGEEAWRAHVAWGIAKAKEVADVVPAPGPATGNGAAVAVVAMNPVDRELVEGVAAHRGLRVHHWRNPGAIAAGLADSAPRWAVVDADHAAADEAVQRLVAAGAAVAVFAEDPDDIATARWMALGAEHVVAGKRLAKLLEGWLPVQA